jgi:MFS family permease
MGFGVCSRILPGGVSINEWLLNISTLLYVIALIGASTYLPRYAVSLGANEASVSLLASSYAATSIPLRLVVGVLSDKGYAKVIMISGSILGSIACLLYMVSSSLEPIYMGRLIHGASVALFIPASLYSASISGEMASRAILWRSLMWSLGFIVGPSVFGVALSIGSWGLVYILAIVFSIASAGISVSYRLPRIYARPREKGGGLLSASFTLASASLFFYVVGYQSISYFLPALHEVRGLSAFETAMFFTLMAITSLASRLALIALRKPDPWATAITGSIASIAGYMLIASNPEGSIAIISATIAGAGMGLLFPSLQIISLLGVPEHRRGAASSIYTAMFDLGALIGPPTIITISGGYRNAIETSTIAVTVTAPLILAIKLIGSLNTRSESKIARYE